MQTKQETFEFTPEQTQELSKLLSQCEDKKGYRQNQMTILDYVEFWEQPETLSRGFTLYWRIAEKDKIEDMWEFNNAGHFSPIQFDDMLLQLRALGCSLATVVGSRLPIGTPKHKPCGCRRLKADTKIV